MAKRTKKQKALEGKVDALKLHAVDDAIKAVRDLASAKFDETLESAMNLGVAPRHANQMARGVVTPPAGTGSDVQVAGCARGDHANKALDDAAASSVQRRGGQATGTTSRSRWSQYTSTTK